MAVGTSVFGLQLAEFSVWPKDGTITVDFTNSPEIPRLSRVGTVLLCQRIGPPVRFRVLSATPLFGSGLLTSPNGAVVKFQMNTEVWVRWFFPGLLWTINTF